MFTKGQLVEAVETGNTPELTNRAIYTVYWSGPSYGTDGSLAGGVRLVEVCPPSPYNSYEARRFRPLQDSRLDVFRAMLVQTPAPVFVPSIFVHNGDDEA